MNLGDIDHATDVTLGGDRDQPYAPAAGIQRGVGIIKRIGLDVERHFRGIFEEGY
jgi:hypothetical protein